MCQVPAASLSPVTAEFFESSQIDATGVVLVAHGLNNKAEVMDELISVLQRAGFHCCRVALHDLDMPRDISAEATEELWLRTVLEARDDIFRRFPNLPIFNLSYSLGALVTVRFLDTSSSKLFERMVLIAPPVALNWSASLLRLLTPLARFGVSLPSAAPKDVRIRSGTPLVEYKALLNMHDAVHNLSNAATLNQTKTLVIVDEDDELVNRSGVLEWINRNELTAWNATELINRHPEKRTYSHLMVIERALGHAAWQSMTDEIISHFRNR